MVLKNGYLLNTGHTENDNVSISADLNSYILYIKLDGKATKSFYVDRSLDLSAATRKIIDGHLLIYIPTYKSTTSRIEI